VASRLFTQDRRRALFITIAVLVVVLLLSARFLASFYVDYLWHDSLGRSDVFWGVLGAKLTMFALFGGVFVLTAVINLVIADQLAPLEFSANTHPLVERFHEVFGRRMRTVRIAAATLFGLVFAVPATTQWQHWTMFRHSQTFGKADAQFGNDIGFYLFRLPFITFAVDWLFAALLIITLMVVGTHLLNGGIVVQPPRPKVRRATKAHLAVLLAVLALVKAADYWLQRYELTTADRGFVRGALYSVVNAQLPATVLLALISVLAAGVFVSTLKTNSWRWPAVVCSLWVVIAVLGGAIYPAIVQRLVVAPNQRDKEAEFIERNITATRQALGIDDVTVQEIRIEPLTRSEVEDDLEPLRNARLLDPGQLLDRFKTDRGEQAGLRINDLDVDRYEIDGERRQVVLAARELDVAGLANKSWQGRHLISTHGCGLAFAPAARFNGQSGNPTYIDPAGLDRPELYFSDRIESFAIVNTSVNEEDCPGQDNAANYTGIGGVRLGSGMRQAAFALAFLDYNIIGSSAIDSDSRIMWRRQVGERVRALAPFLRFDSDPYPVINGGRVLWVIDGYATSDRYPYGQSADLGQLKAGSGLTDPFNYIRGSVKAVVDAYDGSVRFYVVDDADPVLRVWRAAFPDLFTPLAQAPAGLSDHFRYPEDLFRVQTAAYSKYQLGPDQFFDDRNNAWSVAEEPAKRITREEVAPAPEGTVASTGQDSARAQDFAFESTGDRFEPYYSMYQPPDGSDAEFRLFRPFSPFSSNNARRELQAYMTASSDPQTYGQLTVYKVLGDPVSGELPQGPITVYNQLVTEPTISNLITPLAQRGSIVTFGTLQLLPVADGALWLMPMYVSGNEVPQPTFRYVLVYHPGDGRAAYGETIGIAIAKLFPGFDVDLGDRVGGGGSGDPDPIEPEPTDLTPAQLLEQADQLFAEAEDALAAGDLGAYDEKITAARDLVQQAIELLDEQS
jgi:hypothetical protein